MGLHGIKSGLAPTALPAAGLTVLLGMAFLAGCFGADSQPHTLRPDDYSALVERVDIGTNQIEIQLYLFCDPDVRVRTVRPVVTTEPGRYASPPASVVSIDLEVVAEKGVPDEDSLRVKFSCPLPPDAGMVFVFPHTPSYCLSSIRVVDDLAVWHQSSEGGVESLRIPDTALVRRCESQRKLNADGELNSNAGNWLQRGGDWLLQYDEHSSGRPRYADGRPTKWRVGRGWGAIVSDTR